MRSVPNKRHCSYYSANNYWFRRLCWAQISSCTRCSWKWRKVKVLVTQSCPLLGTLWTVACQAPLCRISQARILEWIAIPFSRGSSRPSNWTYISCIAGKFFTIYATREALGALKYYLTFKCTLFIISKALLSSWSCYYYFLNLPQCLLQ